MKTAIIGIGRWGSVLLKQLRNQSEVKYGCDSKSDLDKVFNDPEVDAVFVSTPTSTHFDIARRVLESEKHLFLEKPCTENSVDLEKLVNISKEKNLKFAVGYEFPHHPACQKLRSLISEKKIKSIHLEWYKWGTFIDNTVRHLLCHDVSVLKSLGITGLSPALHHKTKIISDTDIIWTDFKNDQNIYIESNINRVSAFKNKAITVLIEDGGFLWNNDELFEINKEKEELKKIEIDEITPVAAEISDFLTSVKENRQPLINGEFALAIYKVIEQI